MEEQNVNKLVCGMVVDEDLYKEYQSKKYVIGGREVSVSGIEIMSTSKEYRQGLPEDAKEAKKIAEKIQREIREYYAPKDGRKEYVAMKHDTFGEYLADLQEIHAKVAPERTALKEKMDLAKKRWEENQREFKNDEHFLAREKVKFLDAQEEYKNSIKELQRRTQEEIQAVQAEYEKHVTDFYAANGNRLDDSMVRLLNSGIKLTDAEISNMVGQNMSNPTMLRLISDHCEKMGIENQNAMVFGSLARKAGSDEREAFKTIADMVEKAVSENETTSSVWSKEESHFKRLSDEQIGAVGAFWVRPEAPQTQTAE
jgi:hypothetical protein